MLELLKKIKEWIENILNKFRRIPERQVAPPIGQLFFFDPVFLRPVMDGDLEGDPDDKLLIGLALFYQDPGGQMFRINIKIRKRFWKAWYKNLKKIFLTDSAISFTSPQKTEYTLIVNKKNRRW